RSSASSRRGSQWRRRSCPEHARHRLTSSRCSEEPMPVEYVTGAVEGLVDEAVLRRLIREAGMQCVAVYGKEGKPYLIEQLPKYNNAARYAPWCILIDLDRDAGCAPEFIDRILPDRAPGMVARVAVREVESWLLADRVNMAKF